MPPQREKERREIEKQEIFAPVIEKDFIDVPHRKLQNLKLEHTSADTFFAPRVMSGWR